MEFAIEADTLEHVSPVGFERRAEIVQVHGQRLSQ